MKKLISLSALALSLLGAGNVFAGQLSASATITPTACSKLSGDVAVKLSTNVMAAYDCTTSATAIHIATCSTAGQVKDRSIPCGVLTAGSSSTPTVYTNSSCTGVGPTNNYTAKGPAMFTANSSGGQVTQAEMKSTTCTAAQLETRIGTFAAGGS
jgi:hypothetical protein